MPATEHTPVSVFLRASLRALLILAFLGASRWLQAEDFQGSSHALPYDDEIIGYNAQTPTDRVARLQALIAGGEAKLKWDEQYGWLPSVLEALGVPQSSQMLVFSRTSLQRRAIDPRNPRAIYYNDDVYVGYIPNAPMMEISAVDPKLGGIFYSIDQVPGAKPTFVRSQDCLQCHVSGRTLGVPGHFVRSLRTDGSGEIVSGTDTSEVTHCTPMADRWGGWYVTGQHGTQSHLGNLVGLSAFDRHSGEPGFRGNIDDLTGLLDTSKYLRPHSDIVALMLLEHQAHMHNYITRLNYETRIMTERYGHIRYLTSQTKAFLRYLLFTEESPLSAPVHGDPQFVTDFVAKGPRDSKGRSLRDLDLQTRLFRYPCSYLIYSDAFDQMPAMMRDHLLQRLYAVLTGEDKDPEFAKIAAVDRQAVLEILRETKPNLPDYWRNGQPQATVEGEKPAISAPKSAATSNFPGHKVDKPIGLRDVPFPEFQLLGMVASLEVHAADLPPARTVADEEAVLANGRLRAQQNALRRLGQQTDPRADQVLLAQFARFDEGHLPPGIWLEMFEAVGKRDNPALKGRLADRERFLEKAADPLARFRECLVGGDGEAGHKIFMDKVEAGCARCHTVDGKGGQIGPDLTWLRNSVERQNILESIIAPNATLAPGYASAQLKLSGDEEVAGVVTLETGSELTLTTVADGKKRHLKTADIVERNPLPSPMPPHFGQVLTKREIRDLVEFLAAGD